LSPFIGNCTYWDFRFECHGFEMIDKLFDPTQMHRNGHGGKYKWNND
jgi:hypothetical protein